MTDFPLGELLAESCLSGGDDGGVTNGTAEMRSALELGRPGVADDVDGVRD